MKYPKDAVMHAKIQNIAKLVKAGIISQIKILRVLSIANVRGIADDNAVSQKPHSKAH